MCCRSPRPGIDETQPFTATLISVALTVRSNPVLVPEIKRIWNANLQLYYADEVWRQLSHGGYPVARCSVEWLMRRHGLPVVMRVKVARSTVDDSKASVATGQGQLAVQGRATEPSVVLGLCIDLAGLVLRGIRQRCVGTQSRGLTSERFVANRLRARCS